MKYKYELFCSARKSVSVSIDALNRITVRCPWGMRPEAIEKFLDSKESWIEKNISENSVILARNDDILNKTKLYFSGVKYPLVISDENRFRDGVIYLKSIDKVGRFYTKNMSSDFYSRLNKFAAIIGVNPGSAAFKDYKAKWGCCDSFNNIVFNFRILMMPEPLQDYVAVHELCHIIRHDHSDRFWKEVAKVIPDYKSRREQLNYYRFLNSLY